MIDRILEIQESGRFLHLDKHNIVVELKGAEIARIPLEDVSVLLFSTPHALVSTPLVAELAKRGSPTILLGENYQPVGEFYPTLDHTEVGHRIQDQVEASVPLKKQLWRQVVEKKLLGQASVLKFFGQNKAYTSIMTLAGEVLSGDTSNREAAGARVYWQALFGSDFRRDQDAAGLNGFLNYGYAVLRSCVLRAIWAAGLLPYFGLYHQNRSNAGPLADDLMEPFRPLVDCIVYQVWNSGQQNLSPPAKRALTKVIWYDTQTYRGTTPLSRALFYLTESLVKVFQKEQKALDFPAWVWDGGGESCFSADTKSCG